MTILINFSHPLNEEAKSMLETMPYSVHQVIEMSIQVDFGKDLSAQVDSLAKEAIETVGGNPLDIDLIIPPGHSTVAVLLIDRLKAYGARPRIVTMVKKPGIGVSFIPGGIVGMRHN